MNKTATRMDNSMEGTWGNPFFTNQLFIGSNRKDKTIAKHRGIRMSCPRKMIVQIRTTDKRLKLNFA